MEALAGLLCCPSILFRSSEKAELENEASGRGAGGEGVLGAQEGMFSMGHRAVLCFLHALIRPLIGLASLLSSHLCLHSAPLKFPVVTSTILCGI